MASDDWRLRIELGRGAGAACSASRPAESEAEELAGELRDRAGRHRGGHRLRLRRVIAQLERARSAIEREIGELGLKPESSPEHWLDDEDRWDSAEPAPDSTRRRSRGLRAVGGADPRRRPPRGARAGRPARSRGLGRRAPLVVRDRGRGDAEQARALAAAAARRGRARRRARLGDDAGQPVRRSSAASADV